MLCQTITVFLLGLQETGQTVETISKRSFSLHAAVTRVTAMQGSNYGLF